MFVTSEGKKVNTDNPKMVYDVYTNHGWWAGWSACANVAASTHILGTIGGWPYAPGSALGRLPRIRNEFLLRFCRHSTDKQGDEKPVHLPAAAVPVASLVFVQRALTSDTAVPGNSYTSTNNSYKYSYLGTLTVVQYALGTYGTVPGTRTV